MRLLDRRVEKLDRSGPTGNSPAGRHATNNAGSRRQRQNHQLCLGTREKSIRRSNIQKLWHLLKALIERGANLQNPESVRETIARIQDGCSGRKNNAVKAYNLFVAMEGLTWTPPKYKQLQKIPFIPTEREIDDLIAGMNKTLSAFLQFLKESVSRRGEAFNIRWTDLDLVNRTARITAEKGSFPRIFRISQNLGQKLANLPKTSERVFSYKDIYNLEKSFRKQRKNLAHKLGNPRLLQIHLHTFDIGKQQWNITELETFCMSCSS